jgi:hypothetical protein
LRTYRGIEQLSDRISSTTEPVRLRAAWRRFRLPRPPQSFDPVRPRAEHRSFVAHVSMPQAHRFPVRPRTPFLPRNRAQQLTGRNDPPECPGREAGTYADRTSLGMGRREEATALKSSRPRPLRRMSNPRRLHQVPSFLDRDDFAPLPLPPERSRQSAHGSGKRAFTSGTMP